MDVSKNNPGIVLIHGAGLGSFIWNDIQPMLKYPALAVDFPKRGKNYKDNCSLSFDDYLKFVIDQIENWNKNRLILVAHSIGGCIALRLVDYFGERILGILCIGAAIPKRGTSFSSCLSFPQRNILPILLNIFGTKPPDKSIQNELCNDLTENQSSEIIVKFTPESKLLYITKIDYDHLPKETLYVKLTRDKAFSNVVQRKMAQNLGTKNIIEFECGHLPMLGQPIKLAKVLNDFIVKIPN